MKNGLCCICQCTESTKFYRYKNKRGIWDNKSYFCQKCYDNLRRFGTVDIIKIEEIRRRYFEKKVEINRRKINCCICGTDQTYVRPDGVPMWTTHRCNKDNCTGHICEKCSYMHNPNNIANIIRSMRDCRLGKIGLDSPRGKGLIGEAVNAKIRKLEVLSIAVDNYSYKTDLSKDYEYNTIETKFRTFNGICWSVAFGDEHNFDTLFVLCADKERKNITRVYAIPEDALFGIQYIEIVEFDSKWENFRIDEKHYNDAYHDLLLFLNGRKYFSIEDIKIWLE